MAIRLFVNAPLASGAVVALDSNQSHYLGRVMRLGPGDSLVLFNGVDGEFAATITGIARTATAALGGQIRPQSSSSDRWLLFAPIKRDATDLVVRAATELGVSRLCPVTTAYTQSGRINAERFEAIAREAAEQCERLNVPDIAPLRPLTHYLGEWEATRTLYAALERTGALPAPPSPGRMTALLIGPEGGFSPDEKALLGRLPYVAPLNLGKTILRAETAAIAGLAQLNFLDTNT